jgi:hypothetical protein
VKKRAARARKRMERTNTAKEGDGS